MYCVSLIVIGAYSNVLCVVVFSIVFHLVKCNNSWNRNSFTNLFTALVPPKGSGLSLPPRKAPKPAAAAAGSASAGARDQPAPVDDLSFEDAGPDEGSHTPPRHSTANENPDHSKSSSPHVLNNCYFPIRKTNIYN